MAYSRSFFLLMLVLSCSFLLFAQEKIDASKLVREADLLLRGEKSAVQYVEFIVHRPGKIVERKLISYLKGHEYSFSHILQPIRDKDITLLKREHDMWMYTPKVRKEIRIPFAMMHEGVMGSDFTYDDLLKEATLADDYSHKAVGISKAMYKKHGKVYIIDLTPLPDRPVTYKKLRLWIRYKDKIMLRIQYYNDDLQVDRVMTLSGVRNIGGRKIPTVQTLVDMTKKEHYTVFHILNAEYNKLDNDKMFDKRSLQNPPTPPQWKKVQKPKFALPNASELVKKADLLLRGEKSSIQYAEFIVHRPGKVVERKMISYLKGKKYSFSHILTPIRDKGITLLKRDYDMWMYTPKVRKEIRIPFAMMHEGVMGSDFTYDDLLKEATFTDDYSHKIIGISKAMYKEHGKVYIVDLTPLPDRPITYKKLRMWIRERDNNFLRIQYYNDDMKVDRMMVLSDVRKMDDRVIPTTQRIVDLTKKDHYTIFKIINAKYNSIEDEKMFKMRSLQNPPSCEFEK